MHELYIEEGKKNHVLFAYEKNASWHDWVCYMDFRCLLISFLPFWDIFVFFRAITV